MESVAEIRAYVLGGIRRLQERWNFNPNMGGSQAKGARAKEAWGRFHELLTLGREIGVEEVPYDPAGLNPLEIQTRLEQRTCYVYFLRRVGTDIIKIGHSVRPIDRGKGVQTGNDGVLEMLAMVEGGPALERRLLRRLASCKTRDRHKDGKGEWVFLEGISKAAALEMAASLSNEEESDNVSNSG